MKKIISFILALVTAFSVCSPACYANNSEGYLEYYNALKEKQKNEPYFKYGLWITGEHFNNNVAYKHNAGGTVSGVITYDYLYQHMMNAMPELKAERILNNNYAFVSGSVRFWNKNSVKNMKGEAKLENGTFYIPADAAAELFGIKSSSAYVSAKEIEEMTGLETYFDARGFMLVAERISAVLDISTENATSENPFGSFLDIDSCISLILWENIDFTEQDFIEAEKRLVEIETYPYGMENEFPEFNEKYINDAKGYMELVDYDNPKSSPFTDIEIVDYDGMQGGQAAIQTALVRIQEMARGFNLAKRCGYDADFTNELKDAILYAFEFMMEKHYFNNIYPGNGGQFVYFAFNWKYYVAKTIAFMGEELDEETRIRYAAEVWSRTQIPVTMNNAEFGEMTFTNRFWTLYSALQVCFILRDSGKANFILRNMNSCFQTYSSEIIDNSFPASSDGFFDDGSFPYHTGYPYNLGYGESMLNAISYCCAMTSGTAFDLRAVPNFNGIYDLIKNNYLPFIYASNKMHIVQGRERAQEARSPLAAALIIVSGADDKTKAELAPYFKASITDYDTFAKRERYINGPPSYPFTNPYIAEYLEQIRNLEQSEETENIFENFKVFYKMDRAVYRSDDYAAAFGFSSERIEKYESELTSIWSCQNWYVSDGMIYIYKDGDENMMQKYFDGQDPYFMPGTTIDSIERNPLYRTMVASYHNEPWGKGENSWAGGVTDGKTGVVGMIAGNKWVTGLDYKKSYFVFDDKIICLGSGITAGEGHMGKTTGDVYTTVDNRFLVKRDETKEQKKGWEDVYVDGKLLDVSFDEEMSFADAKWSWTEGNNGYLYLQDAKLTLKRVLHDVRYSRSGRTNEGDEEYTFLETVIHHGENPKDESYAYVMLPNKTLEETEALSIKPDFEIIEQTSSAHIVKDLRNGTVYANVFEPSVVEGIEVLTPCSLMIKRDNGLLNVYVAEPNQKNKYAEFKFDSDVIAMGAEQDGNTVRVNFRSYGGTSNFRIIDKTKASSGDIKVLNYNISYSGGVVCSKLYAESKNEENVSFNIVVPPKKGVANLIDGVLYYSSDNFEETTIIVEAKTESGAINYFSISING